MAKLNWIGLTTGVCVSTRRGAMLDFINVAWAWTLDHIDVVRAWAEMSRSELISTTGAAFGFIGGVLLAYAASRELAAQRLAVEALQLETTVLIRAFKNPNTPIVQVHGVDRHIALGQRWNTWLTRLGVLCLMISVGLTIGAFFVPKA